MSKDISKIRFCRSKADLVWEPPSMELVVQSVASLKYQEVVEELAFVMEKMSTFEELAILPVTPIAPSEKLYVDSLFYFDESIPGIYGNYDQFNPLHFIVLAGYLQKTPPPYQRKLIVLIDYVLFDWDTSLYRSKCRVRWPHFFWNEIAKRSDDAKSWLMSLSEADLYEL